MVDWLSFRAGLLTMLLAAQATAAPETDVWRAIDDHLARCEPLFADADAAARAGDATDANYWRVPGHPYVRVDRLMASYVDRLEDVSAAGEWLEQLRDNDAFAREIELANLGIQDPERRQLLDDLRLCAVWQTTMLMAEPETARTFIAAVAGAIPGANAAQPVPQQSVDDCAAVGAASVAGYWHAEPLPGERPAADTVLAGYPKLRYGGLGRANMFASWRERLAELHAPRGWASAGAPGLARLYWDGDDIAGNPGQPTLYYHFSHARSGTQALEQITYLGFETNDAGTVSSGWAWRVTLATDGQPLAYEYLRLSGRDHVWYPTARLRPAEGSAAPLAMADLTWHSGCAAVPVARPASIPAGAHRYRLLPYDHLFRLPRPGGGTRSAFDPRGHLRGPTPEPLYQLGHLSLDADDTRAFDAPWLLLQQFPLAGAAPGYTKGWDAGAAAAGP